MDYMGVNPLANNPTSPLSHPPALLKTNIPSMASLSRKFQGLFTLRVVGLGFFEECGASGFRVRKWASQLRKRALK